MVSDWSGAPRGLPHAAKVESPWADLPLNQLPDCEAIGPTSDFLGGLQWGLRVSKVSFVEKGFFFPILGLEELLGKAGLSGQNFWGKAVFKTEGVAVTHGWGFSWLSWEVARL